MTAKEGPVAASNRCAWPVLFALCAGCGSEAPPAAPAPAEVKLVAKGAITATAATGPISIDYSGVKVAVAATHRLASDAKGYGCFTKVTLAVEKADGSCRMELVFSPSTSGPKLTSGKLYAVKAQMSDGQIVGLVKCGGMPDVDKATKERVFEVIEGNTTLNLQPLGPGKANQKLYKATGQKLQLSGNLDVKNLGTKLSFATAALSFEGSFESIGDPAGDCGGGAPKTGSAQCDKAGKPGENPGETFRRETRPFRCDAETEEYDLGELCGNDAIWIIDWRNWAKNSLLKSIDGVRGAFKGKSIGVAVVVVEGNTKIPVEDPPGSGTFKPLGPAPAATECQAIATENKVPQDVIMLFDKEKQLTYQGKKLTNSKFIPAMLFAKPDGTIVKILPETDGKEPQLSDITGAIQMVLDAP
ncbi:MAG: hypothetical protein FJ100_12635 [Deltaproteobacteria bacterium]|nr:hypothetical protein [Deltaproteobacteria bacterium]